MERDQELRMRCLDMASRGPWGRTEEVIEAAQKLYNFAMTSGNPAKPTEMAQVAA